MVALTPVSSRALIPGMSNHDAPVFTLSVLADGSVTVAPNPDVFGPDDVHLMVETVGVIEDAASRAGLPS